MRKIYAIHGTNVLVNDTKGIQNLHETRGSSSRGSTRSARRARSPRSR